MKYSSKDFSFARTTDSVTITFNGNSTTIIRSNPMFNDVCSVLREKRWDDLINYLSPHKVIEQKSKGYFRVDNDQVYVKTDNGEFKAPKELNAKILDYMKSGQPFEHFVSFAVKLSQNPSERSVDQLFKFLEVHKLELTETGNFLAYKKVRDDFLDFYSGTFDNSPGKVLTVERNTVNADPNEACSTGLHVANYSYANDRFHSGEGKLVQVEVNPKDVVSVPLDESCAKVRVCEYKVLKVVEV